METSVSAADANREFSKLLRQVREKRATYIVTSHGKPVARLTPIDAEDEARKAQREQAKQAWLRKLAQMPVHNAGPWTREELYER